MTKRCHRALDIDLAAYLDAPAADRWAEFRAHSSDCDDCAAEVRAWTALRGESGSEDAFAHPSEELLLGYADDRSGLSMQSLREVEDHLAGCASCRDEVAVLGAIDAAAIVNAAREPSGRESETTPSAAAMRSRAGERPGLAERADPGERPGLVAKPGRTAQPRTRAGSRAGARPPLRGALASVGRVLWHPAFAYAVVLLLVVSLPTTSWRLVSPAGAPESQPARLASKSKDDLAGKRVHRDVPVAPPTQGPGRVMAQKVQPAPSPSAPAGLRSLAYMNSAEGSRDLLASPHASDRAASEPTEPAAAVDAPAAAVEGPGSAVGSWGAAVDTPEAEVEPPGAVVEAPKAALRAPKAALRAPKAALRAPKAALRAPGGELRAPEGTLRAPKAAITAPEAAMEAAMEARGAAAEAVRAADERGAPLVAERRAVEGLRATVTNVSTLSFVPGGHDVISTRDLPVVLDLRISLIVGDDGVVPTEARIIDATGRRELRETFAAADGGGTAIMAVPSAWLTPGRYSVTVGPAGLHDGEPGFRDGEADLPNGEADSHEGEADLHNGEADSREGEADLHNGEADSHEGRSYWAELVVVP